jgi:SNF2 family DNA or RNA helicase
MDFGPLKLPLKENQMGAMTMALGQKYSILALPMGSGKTPIGLAIKEKSGSKRCLVICPASLILNWRNEIKKFLDDKVVSVFKSGKEFYYPVDSDYVICSYDLAIKHPFIFSWADILICDEAHYLKDMGSKRTEAIHRHIYEYSVPRVLLMTGTPLVNRVKEFYSLIAICEYSPEKKFSEFLDKFPDHITFADHFSFRREFEKWIRNRPIKIVKWEGLRNVEELKKWLIGKYIKIESNLAPINYKDVMLADFDDKSLLDAFNKSMEDLEGIMPNIKEKAALRKVPLTVSYISDLRKAELIEGPVVVFTDHRASAHLLAKELGAPTAITGEMSVAQRQKLADRFQAGEIETLVATFGSFSQGHTLTKSNYMVMNDYPWAPSIIRQAEFRINRIGQNRPCYVDRIFGSSQDEYIFKTLLDKEEVIKKST